MHQENRGGGGIAQLVIRFTIWGPGFESWWGPDLGHPMHE